MKLLFLTSSALSSRSGPSARLGLELGKLSELNEITIFCLGTESDDTETRNEFQKVSFLHLPAQYEGWSLMNIDEILKNTYSLIDRIRPDLVILNMEIWDLAKAFGSHLRNQVPFAMILHAMPFLGAPVFPTGNFEEDVLSHANSGIEEYRKQYILAHYKETSDVLKSLYVVANNKTVTYYLQTYFPNLQIYAQSPAFTASRYGVGEKERKFTYDFVYMARMEAGKGVEYFSELLSLISIAVGRKVSLAILGRTGDTGSKLALEALLVESKRAMSFSVDYLGWADDAAKESALSASRVFLYPSCYDNYPTVLNEALAHQLPCVTWDVPFARLNYMSTDAVRLAEFGNSQQFTEHAVYALRNRESMSAAARQFVDQFDTLDRTAEMDSELFAKIAHEGPHA